MPAASSPLGRAFQSLLDAKANASGERDFVWIDGVKIEALISEVTADEINIMGGVAESGGFRARIAIEDHPNKPEQGTEIEARGMALQILSSVNRNGVTWEITAGDPSAEES